jgi:tetratricopeptide (TPR) repeat protein
MSIELSPSLSQPKPTIKLWTPNTIGALTFFLGFPAGIALATINWKKMGMTRKVIPHILLGIVGIAALILVPDNIGRIIGLTLTWGYIAFVRKEMKSDIEKLDGFNVQNAPWYSGFFTSVALYGIVIIAGIGFVYLVGFVESLSPGNSQYHANRGDEYSNNGNYDLAIDAYTKAIELETDENLHPILYYYRGIAYYNKGEMENAISDFSRVIETKPKESRAFLMRGAAYSSNHEYKLAVVDFTQAIQINPDDMVAFYNRGFAYENQGDFKNAISDFSQVIKNNPKDGEAYSHRGLNYAQNGDYELSVDDFTQAIKINPKDAVSYFNRGLSYENLRLNNEAIHDFEKVLELSADPNLRDGSQKELLKLKGKNLQ